VADKARVLDAYQILDLVEERLKIFQDRNAWYDKLMRYYDGKSYGSGAFEPEIMSSNSQGRPLLRQVGESINTNRTYSSQRLAPIVDDYAGLLGRMPTVRVDAPTPDEDGEGRAEKETKYLYSTYEMSNMDYQQAEAGFYLSGMGDVCYVLEPDGESDRVVWNVVNPAICYPAFYKGYKRFQIYDLVTVEQWNPDDIRNNLDIEPESEDADDCKVIMYMSPRQRTVLVGNKRVQVGPNAQWDLGFCPATWVFNKVTGSMGRSDIGHSLDQQDFLDYAFNVWADGIVYMTYPLIGIKNPMNIGETKTVGPGEVIDLQGDGDILVRNSQGDPHAISSIIDITLGDISAATGSSPVRQEGMVPQSHTTGRAIHAAQGPQSTRIDFKQQVLGAAIRDLNSKTLAMQEKAPALRGWAGDIYGRWKGQSFVEEFSAKEISGWYRNTVTWEQMVGMNLQQKLQVAYEGVVAKVWDRVYAMQMVGVDDPLGMEKRVDEMAKKDVQAQQGAQPGGAAGQAPPGGGGVAQPSGGQAQQSIPIMKRPASAAPPQAQQIGRAPEASAGPQPVTAQELQQALAGVRERLRGEVFKVGDRELAITDPTDHQKVVEATKSLGKLKVRYVSKAKLPSDAEKVV
jgi:hypothetical protein